MLKDDLLSLLVPVHQEHLLRYWDELSPRQQQSLAAQIQQVDWKQLNSYIASVSQGMATEEFNRLIPAPYRPATPRNEEEAKLYQKAIARGIELLSTGKVAAFTVAGGQGSRLGFDGPKGTYLLSALKNKSLFQLFAEKILYAQKKYNTTIPWYLMTSTINHQATLDFFSAHQFFGLQPTQVHFFIQGMIPAMDLTTKKALMSAKDAITLTANGHGGSFMALHDSGALQEMKAKGITTITYWQVDNPMVRPFDPLFLGLHDLTGSEMSSRALIKRDAKEKLGHFSLLDGKMTIVEYSDMPDELLQKKDADGQLSFRAGSPAIHVLSRTFVERLTNGGTLNLPAHKAIKKVAHMDEQGNLVTPTTPNALKLEFFLFDALPMAKNPLILEGDRRIEFAPVKNAEGNDSPDSSRAAMNEKAASLFEAAGLPFPRKPDGTPDAIVEFNYAAIETADDLLAIRPPLIHPGDKLYLGE